MGELQDIPVTLGGQTYKLRFSIRAIFALKRRWSLDSEADVQRRIELIKQKADLEDTVTLIWAGLQTHHPELTEDQVLGWLDDGGVEAIEAVQETFENAKPLPAKTTGNPPEGQRKRSRNR